MVSVHKKLATVAISLTVFLGSAQYSRAQDISALTDMTNLVKLYNAEYKELCRKLDEGNTEFNKLSSEMHFAYLQYEHGKNRLEQLSGQLDDARLTSLISAFDRFLGNDAPSEAEMSAKVSKIRAKRKTVRTFINEWVPVYNNLLARIKATIKDINNRKSRKKELKKVIDSFQDLIDKHAGRDRGIIDDDGAKKLKKAKNQAEKASKELEQSILKAPSVTIFTTEVANVTDGAKKSPAGSVNWKQMLRIWKKPQKNTGKPEKNSQKQHYSLLGMKFRPIRFRLCRPRLFRFLAV